MNVLSKILCGTALVSILACGGGGGVDTFGLPENGSYQGLYYDGDATRVGTATINISGNALTGTLVRDQSGDNATLTTTFDGTGVVSGTLSNSGFDFPVSGNVTLKNRRELLGDFLVTDGIEVIEFSIRATKR